MGILIMGSAGFIGWKVSEKKVAEITANTYQYLYRLDVSALQYFTLYNPAGRPDMSKFRFIK